MPILKWKKIIFLCNEFNLNVNDLLNGDIYEIKHKNEAIKDIYKIIDKIVNFFVDSFSLFFKMTLKSKIRFIFELFFLLFVLGLIFFVLGEILSEIMVNLFYFVFPNKVYFIITSILSFIYYSIVSTLSVAIVIEVIKRRYLKYYKENKIDSNENEKKEKERIEFKNKESKIIIRDIEDSNYKVLSILYKAIIFFFKILLLFILIPLLLLLIFLAFVFISSFLILKTGFFFLGLIIVIISTIILCFFLTLLIANFVFNRKNNFKLFIHTSIINFIIIGCGIGFIFIGSLSFNLIENYDSKIFKTNENIVEMHQNLKIENYNIIGDIKFIEENRNDIKIKYDYNSVFYSEKTVINIFEVDNYSIIYIRHFQDNPFKILRIIFKELNENNTINYSSKLYNFQIYGTKENLKIIENNIQKND